MAVSTRIAVIAVGDRSRHDDGIGPAVLARLRERAPNFKGRLPRHLVAYAVEAGDVSHGTGLSAPVAAEVGAVAGLVEEEIARHRSGAARDRSRHGA
jgi:hydrogenase maturation protease